LEKLSKALAAVVAFGALGVFVVPTFVFILERVGVIKTEGAFQTVFDLWLRSYQTFWMLLGIALALLLGWGLMEWFFDRYL